MKKLSIFVTLLVFCSTFSLQAQTYEELVVKGMEYAKAEEYTAAVAAFETALRNEPSNPSNVMLMVNLATMKRNLGEYEQALVLYSTPLENYPENTFIRHNRAALYCEMNRFDDALKDYNTILVYDEKDHEAMYRRALIQLERKDFLAAEEDFKEILKMVPEHFKAKLGMGMILKGRQEWEEAEELYTNLIYKYKQLGVLYYHRAECYLNMKKLARTQEDITQANKWGYDPAAVQVLQGQLFLAQYDKIKAKACFLKAIELGINEKDIEGLLNMSK